MCIPQYIGSSYRFVPVGGSDPAVTYQSSTSDATNTNVYTFSSMAIGAEASRDAVVVSIHSRASASDIILSSVTIGGVTAIPLATNAENQGDGTTNFTGIYGATGVTGTSADVVATFATTQVRAGVIVWTVNDLSQLTPEFARKDDAGNYSVTAGSVDTGVITASSYTSSGTWTGVTNSASLNIESGGLYANGGQSEYTTVGSKTITWSQAGATGTSVLFGDTPQKQQVLVYAISNPGSTSVQSTTTLSSVPIGAASSGRIVLIICNMRSTGNDLSGATVTIGGASANVVAKSGTDSGARFTTLIAWRNVTSGTTADIVLSLNSPGSSSSNWLYAKVYRLDGYSTTADDTGVANGSVSLSDTLSCTTGSIVLAGAVANPEGQFNATWTNITEDFDANSATSDDTATGAYIVTGGTSISPQVDFSNANAQFCAFATVALPPN